MPFFLSYSSVFKPDSKSPVYIIEKDTIAVKVVDGRAVVPKFGDFTLTEECHAALLHIGRFDDTPCYAAEPGDAFTMADHDLTMVSWRKLFAMLSADEFAGALCSFHLVNWNRTTRFCGRCGQPTQMSAAERAKTCSVCGHTSYPRISPAVIVAIVKDDKILLGHSDRFPKKFYSVIAGFVEPGETLEECVAREAKEEVGIDVTDIRYFSSQPWPFPDSLMIGFTAAHAGGEICVDGKEITGAEWFSADKMPEMIPEKVSISRKLIDWFVEKHTKGA